MKVQNESAARKEMEQLQINKLRLTKIKQGCNLNRKLLEPTFFLLFEMK